MKIVLVKPVDTSAFDISPDLGIGYLAATLRAAGHEVEILDCIKEKLDMERFTKHFSNNRYDVVGFKAFAVDLSTVRESLKIIEKTRPEAVRIVGGPAPSGAPLEVMEYLSNVDFAFAGEAEMGLPKLLKCLESGNKGFRDVEGLVWRDNDRVVVNKRGYIDDLDSIGLPAWDLIHPNDYPFAPHGIFAKSFPTAPIITTRGCPYLCTYCAAESLSGRKIRYRSVENIVKELTLLRDKYGVNDITILDDNFTLNRKFVQEFCRQVIEKGLKLTWSCPNGVRLDTLDEEILSTMEDAGCYSIAVGVESGSQKILDHMKKNLTLEEIEKRINFIKQTNIKVTGNFIIGYPEESREDIERSIEFSQRLKLDKAWFGLFIPFPGTASYDMLKAQDKLGPLNWDSFCGDKVSWVANGFSLKELKDYHRKAYWRFYMRPRVLWGLIKEIKSWKHVRNLFQRTAHMLAAS